MLSNFYDYFYNCYYILIPLYNTNKPVTNIELKPRFVFIKLHLSVFADLLLLFNPPVDKNVKVAPVANTIPLSILCIIDNLIFNL